MLEPELTSGTFTRVRLFTDIEDITLDKWLDAENAGRDDLAKKILDAGLLVEHMIAEIPLEQNLADNSELRELRDNADRVFGLIVCLGCNRAFQAESDQTKTCPNCGAKLSRPELTPTNLGPSTKTGSSTKKKEKVPLQEPEKHPPQLPKSTSTTNKAKKHPRLSREEKKKQQSTPSGLKNGKTSEPVRLKPQTGPSAGKEAEAEKDSDEDWFGSSTNPAAQSGKHSLKSR